MPARGFDDLEIDGNWAQKPNPDRPAATSVGASVVTKKRKTQVQSSCAKSDVERGEAKTEPAEKKRKKRRKKRAVVDDASQLAGLDACAQACVRLTSAWGQEAKLCSLTALE